MVETMDLCPKMSNICRKVCTYCQNPTSSRCVPLPKISQAKLVFSAEAALKLNQRSIRDGRVTCTTPDLTGLTNQFLSTLLSSQAVASQKKTHQVLGRAFSRNDRCQNGGPVRNPKNAAKLFRYGGPMQRRQLTPM
jgi:hypothetical protein